jgi:hypothetical protein
MFRVAETKDTKHVCALMNKNPHNVFVRDVNGGAITAVTNFTVGPFTLLKEEGVEYIVGWEIEKDRERHLRIVENDIVELRNPREAWHQPSLGAIRLYIPKK